MTLTVLCALIGLGVLYVIALTVIVHCAFRFHRTSEAAKRGDTMPAIVYAGVVCGLAVVLWTLGLQPPWPIDWNATASSLSGWELYYVFVIASMQAFALAAIALFVGLVVVLIASRRRSRLTADRASEQVAKPATDH